MNNTKSSLRLDKVGMFISGLCALHCSVIPFALLLGIGGGLSWIMSHEVEIVFFLISLTLASISLIHGYSRIHRNSIVLIVALIGFISFLVGHEISGFALKIILTSMGGVSILIAHYLNYKFQSRGLGSKYSILASNL